jgi:hypothetical protein
MDLEVVYKTHCLYHRLAIRLKPHISMSQLGVVFSMSEGLLPSVFTIGNSPEKRRLAPQHLQGALAIST